ncbi:MAG: ABC transporter permease [Rhodoferax sp.]|nr:ABC transporter permease [Rhodoferax sp.]
MRRVAVLTSGSVLRPARLVYAWLLEWRHLGYWGAVLLVLALSPSTYRSGRQAVFAQYIYRNTAPILLGFSVISALVTVVLTRIVLVTAMSYGLSFYALQLVIRVLVLELIPLTGALFVAMRCTIPDAAELAQRQAQLPDPRSLDALQSEVMPRVLAGLFAGITLAALSGVLVPLVAYLTAYGLSLSGLASYTRMFGQIFSPAVTLVFALKTLLFCLAVSLIPMASALLERRTPTKASVRTHAETRELVRMLLVLLLIELVSLVGNYY